MESFAGGFTTNWSNGIDGAKVFETEDEAQYVLDHDLRKEHRCQVIPLNPNIAEGDTVYLRMATRSNAARRAVKDKTIPEEYVIEATVLKVGRKYLTVSGTGTWEDLRFRLEDLKQEADNQDYLLFRTRRAAIDDVKEEMLWQSIRQSINSFTTARPTLKDLQTIASILHIS